MSKGKKKKKEKKSDLISIQMYNISNIVIIFLLHSLIQTAMKKRTREHRKQINEISVMWNVD